MLESAHLRIGPWEADTRNRSVGRARAICSICDASTNMALGVVRWRQGLRRRWLCWFARPVWQICETQDDSLLMTIQGAWLWSGSWEVFDAEPRHIGSVQGIRLVDGAGLELAYLERLAQPGGLRLLNTHGLELASVQRDGGATSLLFRPIVEGEPFLKMLILAAALAWRG